MGVVATIHSATGNSHAQQLRPPRADGSAIRTFDHLGVAALTASKDLKLIFGCGAAMCGLGVPAVVVWDFFTGLAIAEYSPEMPPAMPQVQMAQSVRRRSEDGLRFGLSDRVECLTADGWILG